MQRLAATGLATAFFRLFILDTLATEGPARPNLLLLKVTAERLPFASGAFSRALQSLLENGHLHPAPHGAVALTALGAAERMQELARWRAVMPAVARLVGETEPRAAPSISEAASYPAPPRGEARVADLYLDQVLVAAIRDRMASARDGGRPFVVVLGAIDIEHPSVAHQRAMVHRAIRATLGAAATLFGSDVDAYRYGDTGVALLAPCAGDADRAPRLAALLRARIDELIHTMATTVRAFGGARWRVRAGAVTWAMELVTTAALLRIAQDELAQDGAVPA
ncbi:MAG TPA: hypothetical protein VFW12_00220 [Candidatus Limnocylindria bacterium]|nr:hypothetical protein [Candidatus Limnocylindria bacterium]